MHKLWQCGRFEFALERPILMGIVNATPDSFFDGGSMIRQMLPLRMHASLHPRAHIFLILVESLRGPAQRLFRWRWSSRG